MLVIAILKWFKIGYIFSNYDLNISGYDNGIFIVLNMYICIHIHIHIPTYTTNYYIQIYNHILYMWLTNKTTIVKLLIMLCMWHLSTERGPQMAGNHS